MPAVPRRRARRAPPRGRRRRGRRRRARRAGSARPPPRRPRAALPEPADERSSSSSTRRTRADTRGVWPTYRASLLALFGELAARAGFPVVEVAAAVVERAGRFLVTRRDPAKHLGGLWEFPGGKREPGESLEACLARELDEELGVRVRVGARAGHRPWTYPDRRVLLHFFRCRLAARADHAPRGPALPVGHARRSCSLSRCRQPTRPSWPASGRDPEIRVSAPEVGAHREPRRAGSPRGSRARSGRAGPAPRTGA